MKNCQCCGQAYETTSRVAGYCPICQHSQDVIDSHIDGNHSKLDPTTGCVYCIATEGIACLHQI